MLDTLEEVMRECRKFQPLNPYARQYLDAMPEAYDMAEKMYGQGNGMRGVRTQVLYFLNNVKAKGDEQKALKKQLTSWANGKPVKTAGACVWCGKPVPAGRRMCSWCEAEKAEAGDA
jgi:hypothetical protein